MARLVALTLSSSLCAFLAACGSSTDTPADTGGPNPIPPQVGTYISLSDTTSTEDTFLSYRAQNRTTALTGAAGTLDHDTNEFLDTFGRYRGNEIDDDRLQVSTSGGTLVATFSNPADTDHMRIFREPNGIVGVIGQATVNEDIPTTGSSNYTGVVELTVERGADTFDANGDVSMSASWAGQGTVSTTYSNLSIESGPSAGDISGTISVTDSRISGRNFGFENGSFSTDVDFFGTLNDPQVEGGGSFFGPNASEAGGVMIIDDTATGDVFITAVHSANES